MNIVGARIRERRKQLGLTQNDVAARLQLAGLEGINQATVSKVENGTRRVYDYEVHAYAGALHVTADWLLDGAPPQRTTTQPGQVVGARRCVPVG